MFISINHQKKKVVLEMYSLCNLAHFKLSKEKKKVKSTYLLGKEKLGSCFLLGL
jgi:hypothetical protein